MIDISNKSTAFLNFNTLKFDTVFKTQVLNWIQIYEYYGIKFDLVMFKSIREIFHKFKKEKKYIRNNFHNRLYYIYIFKPDSVAGKIYIFFVFLLILMRYWHKKSIVVQIRSPHYHSVFLVLKKIFLDKLRIIYDSRAALSEERKYGQLKEKNHFNEKEVKHLLKKEREMVKLSDLVFCVSNVLKKYHLKNDPAAENTKFFISPCNADSDLFYFSDEIRNKIRHKLFLEKRKVLIYSGGLEMPWHVPGEIFNFFQRIHEIDNTCFLLLLTHDEDIAEIFLKEYKIQKSNIGVISLDNQEVGDYLNAADLSILLREDVPMNNVASPTKFAEYLMTGLPVVISENVGDFSQFVKDHNCGYVLPSDYNSEDLQKIILNLNTPEDLEVRKEISQLGKKHFSKRAKIEAKLKKYYSLCR